MATLSSVLAWAILGTEEPGWLQSWGRRVGATERLNHVCVCVCVCARVRARPTLRPQSMSYIAYRALLSMEFSRQEYWSQLPFPSPKGLPDPGIEPTFFASPAFAGGLFTS